MRDRPRFRPTPLVSTIVFAAFVGLAAALWHHGPAHADEVVIKLWSRADRTGPLRAGNIVAAAKLLNKQLAAAGAARRVRVRVHENNARGYDADALDLMKAFAVGRGPDIFVAAHEWIGAFAEDGFAWDLEDHIGRHPEYYADIIPVLWNATRYRGRRYAVPQDSEIRMFFFRKDMLRRIGKTAAFIEALPRRVERGAFTIWDLSRLAKEVVDAGVAKYGIVHRPNVGPDFLMLLASFGFEPFDRKTGRLKASRKALSAFLAWIDWNAKNGVTPRNNTAMSWDTVNRLMPEGKAFIKHHGVWDVGRQIAFGVSENSEAAYMAKVGWLHAPPAEVGGEAQNLSHPVVYAVSAKSAHRELAATLVGIASAPYFNTAHAVTTNHTAISHGQQAMPAYRAAWALRVATPMLARATFMPNHPRIGEFNAILFKGIQGVETGRLNPARAAAFVLDELKAELDDQVVIVE